MADDEERQQAQEKAREEAAAAAEAERERKIQEAEEKARKAEEARIRAEAQLEAHQKLAQQAVAGQTQGWSDEQWQQFQEKTGLSREAVIANAQLTQQLIEKSTREVLEKAAKAEERAIKAEERLARIEGDRGAEGVKAEFFAKKPQLARYKSEVDGFLQDFPEEMKRDPKKLQGLLEKAEIYVRGKVGAKMTTDRDRAGSAGGPRLGRDDEPGGAGGEGLEVDTEGLSESQAGLVRRIAPNAEGLKRLREQASESRDGIHISGEREWAEAEARVKR